MKYPELKDKVCHQPVYFVSDKVELQIPNVDDWDLDSDRVITVIIISKTYCMKSSSKDCMYVQEMHSLKLFKFSCKII